MRLEIIDSGLDVSARWARLAMSPAAQDYLAPLPPGTPVSSEPSVAELTPVPPYPTAPLPHEAARRGHFAMVKAHVQAIDWLELHPLGHRRALWREGQWEWVVP